MFTTFETEIHSIREFMFVKKLNGAHQGASASTGPDPRTGASIGAVRTAKNYIRGSP